MRMYLFDVVEKGRDGATLDTVQAPDRELAMRFFAPKPGTTLRLRNTPAPSFRKWDVARAKHALALDHSAEQDLKRRQRSAM